MLVIQVTALAANHVLGIGILSPLGFAHYRLPLQKQWQTPHSQLRFSVSVKMETQL